MEETITLIKPIGKKRLSRSEKIKKVFSSFLLIIIEFILLNLMVILLKQININVDYIQMYLLFITIITITFLPKIISHTVEYIVYSIANNEYKKDCMKYANYDNIKYYRENLSNELNINMIAYMADLELDNNANLVAGVLNLEKKGYLKVTKNNIKLIDKDTDPLSDSEFQLFISLKNKDVYEQMIYWQLETMVECYEKGMIEKYNGKDFTYKKILMFLLIFVSLIGILVIGILTNNYEAFLNFISLPVVSIAMVSVIIYIIAYCSKEAESPYKRTRYGEDITARIIGIREYIKDFSILDERKKAELNLWDDYLILACLFNINKSIVADTSNAIVNYVSK